MLRQSDRPSEDVETRPGLPWLQCQVVEMLSNLNIPVYFHYMLVGLFPSGSTMRGVHSNRVTYIAKVMGKVRSSF